MAKNHKGRVGIVYSTDPGYQYQSLEDFQQPNQAPENNKQKLTVQLDKRNRGGKQVTLITGFVGTFAQLEDLGKKLKNHCGTGGTAKDYEIIIQGDNRQKVAAFLQKQGFQVKML
jgi:translation initiation factor 1